MTLLEPMTATGRRRGPNHEFALTERHGSRKPAAVREPFTPVAITNYESLIDLFRARASELGISRSTIDDIAGLPDGLASKILSLKHIKRIGLGTLGPILDTLGLKLIAIPDESALERNRSRFIPRNESQVRPSCAKRKAKG